MKTAIVVSRCECEAELGAEIDENRRALHGWARLRARQLGAPTNAMGSANERFQVGWACPFCTRNTLRAFDTSALTYRDKAATAPSVPPASRAPSARPPSSTR
jgi:hypothetical protein